jgi:hypothetical protein
MDTGAMKPSEWNRLRTEVATAAGVAAHSYSRAGGGTFTLKNAAYIMNNVDPITNWAMSIEDTAAFLRRPQDLR